MCSFVSLQKQIRLAVAGLFISTTTIAICCEVAAAKSPLTWREKSLLALQNKSSPLAPAWLAQANPNSDYTLGGGDRIRVDVFKLPQYSGEYQVLVNGTVVLPQIGNVVVRGLTVERAAAAIAARYTSVRILRDPQITVTLLAPRPLKIGLAGEINRPGSYTIPVEGSQFPSLTQALKLAGGTTQAADLRNAQIVRVQGNSKQKINVNLWQLLQTGELDTDISLRDGDTIFIPTAERIDLAESPQLAAASFASENQPINVAILGEVNQPGTHIIESKQTENSPGGRPTVTQALIAAGGIKPLADVRQVQIRRATKTGGERVVAIDLWRLLQKGDLTQDLILQNGDTVYVPTTENLDIAESAQLRGTSFAPSETKPINVTIIGEVFRPGPYTVTGSARTGAAGVPGGVSGEQNVPPTVTRAVQVAGGIKPLANIREIKIRRTTSSGEERIITVDLWKLLQEGRSDRDLLLQQGDTIVIPTATALAPEDAAKVAAASFSPDTIEVNIVGEITRPGVVKIPPNTPLNQAIFVAGGFTNRASDDSVVLVRLNPNGTVTKREVSIDFAGGVNDETNPVLYNNDVIVVGRSGLASLSDTLDTVFKPLGSFFTIFNLINLFN
jgi:polysaccharide biosynthesis/export protein